jgi:hypothetical protein
MSMTKCAQHGWQGAELTTAGVKERFACDGPCAGEIVHLDLTWEEVVFPLVALRSELPLPGTHLKDRALHADDEEIFNEVLGTLQPVCARCLRSFIDLSSCS